MMLFAGPIHTLGDGSATVSFRAAYACFADRIDFSSGFPSSFPMRVQGRWLNLSFVEKIKPSDYRYSSVFSSRLSLETPLATDSSELPNVGFFSSVRGDAIGGDLTS